MNVLGDNVLLLTILFFFIIAGMSEANIFEDVNDEMIFIYTIIFLATSCVFLIIVVFILWCLCRRSWMSHRGERPEDYWSNDDATFQQAQKHDQYQLERKETAVPRSFTNEAYEQYNDKGKGLGKIYYTDDDIEDFAF